MAIAPPPGRTGTFAPFRHRTFFAIWVANLVSNFGSLIQGVGASWLMTSLAPSADMVSLVQASTSLPIMLLSLAAGALADIRDRRRVMLAAQGWMLAVSAVLAVMAHGGVLSPWLLLAFTFMIGCGAALNGPAWQSSVGEQVPREDLPGAIALNSLGFNLARASGPAVGGLVVASFGPEAAFLLNAISYVGLIVVLVQWRRPVQAFDIAPESLLPAMGAGLRYASLSPRINRVLVRAAVFGFLAAAIWALMPLVARDVLAGGPMVYGLLLGAFGSGAVLGALTSARMRRTLSNEHIVGVSSIVFGIGAICTGSSSWLPLTILALLGAGACWVLALSTFNILVQLASPRWVVGRTMSVYQMATFGGLAIGSWTWGHVADGFGLRVALVIAGVLMAGSAALRGRLRLPDQETLDVEPSGAWRDPRVALPLPPDAGPIVTIIEYIVPASRQAAFLHAMGALRRVRRRDGARSWTLVEDIAEPDRWIERFERPTWIDHLRQHQRVTNADLAVEARVQAMVADGTRPTVRHLLEHEVGIPVPRSATPTPARTGATDPNVPSGIAMSEPGESPAAPER